MEDELPQLGELGDAPKGGFGRGSAGSRGCNPGELRSSVVSDSERLAAVGRCWKGGETREELLE